MRNLGLLGFGSKMLFFLIFLLGATSLILLYFYKPFLKSDIKTVCKNGAVEASCPVYQSDGIYVVHLGKSYFRVLKKDRRIDLPPVSVFMPAQSILMWERSALSKRAVPLDFAARVGEQDIVWNDEGVYFTHGSNKENSVRIYWNDAPQ